MSFIRAREFLLGAYHDLPNVLFIGSFLLGSLTGYLPLVWLSIGLVLNGAVVAGGQGLLHLLFPTWSQVSQPAGAACSVLGSGPYGSPFGRDAVVVAPSYWLSSAVFFAVFSIYNSLRVAFRPAADGVSQDKVDTRRAFSLSVLVIGFGFLALILARGFSGCETLLGGALGAGIGAAVAIAYWHFLNACGSGTIPDILQVVGNMAPAGESSKVPVVCAP
jgi:hypothetical protein